MLRIYTVVVVVVVVVCCCCCCCGGGCCCCCLLLFVVVVVVVVVAWFISSFRLPVRTIASKHLKVRPGMEMAGEGVRKREGIRGEDERMCYSMCI